MCKEATMAIRDSILPEFDQEMSTTRKTLERVPEGKPDWKPHEKSMTLSRLAGHLAELPSFAAATFQSDSFDFNPPGGQPMAPTLMTSRSQLLEIFDKNVSAARNAISKASDEEMQKGWTLLSGGKTIFSMPRISMMRTMVLSHIIHHRGQLTVYLRLNQVPVPSIYGPSADEGSM
jgi:uncharacterized damage-inducible protein DinB